MENNISRTVWHFQVRKLNRIKFNYGHNKVIFRDLRR
jgi:hypothetical protein